MGTEMRGCYGKEAGVGESYSAKSTFISFHRAIGTVPASAAKTVNAARAMNARRRRRLERRCICAMLLWKAAAQD
jgi:hypothetical protein